MKPRAIVTCGPSYEPIDSVRRITNHSTGELGTILTHTLVESGFEVLCLRGAMATFPAPTVGEVAPFTTNQSLETLFTQLPFPPDAIFHAAALGDFTLDRIEGAHDLAQKIRGDISELRLVLRPAAKVLPRLRTLFPEAVIVGWKYELDGSRNDAIARGQKQIMTSRNNACVVNGSAYGPGFGFLENAETRHLTDKPELCRFLAGWTLTRLDRR